MEGKKWDERNFFAGSTFLFTLNRPKGVVILKLGTGVEEFWRSTIVGLLLLGVSNIFEKLQNVETSIHRLKISHPSVGRTQRQDDLLRGLYLQQSHSSQIVRPLTGEIAQKTTRYTIARNFIIVPKNTYARGHMHPTINQSMLYLCTNISLQF